MSRRRIKRLISFRVFLKVKRREEEISREREERRKVGRKKGRKERRIKVKKGIKREKE